MKNNIYKITLATAMLTIIGYAEVQAQNQTFKAVLNGNAGDHPSSVGNGGFGGDYGDDYTAFSKRAPSNWQNYVAGQSAVVQGFAMTGLGWANDDNGLYGNGYRFFRNAISNHVDIVYTYDSGQDSPDLVDYGLQHGTAFITKYGGINNVSLVDYRTPPSPGVQPTIQSIGPTPMITVVCGHINETAPQSKYGPQLEFIDDCNFPSQSWVFGGLAAKYATIKSAHPNWNVFDVRQALRQSCDHYQGGSNPSWNENTGYGFAQIHTLNDLDASLFVQPSLPADAGQLDAGPPIQPHAQLTSAGTQAYLTWYNFRQSAFVSTVITANGTTIYDGEGTSFLWPLNTSGTTLFQFFTKLVNGNLSPAEIYTKYAVSTYANQVASAPIQKTAYRNTPIDFTVLSGDTSGTLRIASVSALSNPNAGTITINADGQSVHFVPSLTFLGPVSFTFTMTDGTYQFDPNATVNVNVLPDSGPNPVILTTANSVQQLVEGSTIALPFTVSDAITAPQYLVTSVASSSPNLYCTITSMGSTQILNITGNIPVSGATVTLTCVDLDGRSSSITFQVGVSQDPNKPVLTSPTLSGGSPGNSFSFGISSVNNGLSNTTWTVYSSVDLKNWTPVGTVTLGSLGTASYTDNEVNGLEYRFYKLTNGIYSSRAIGFERLVFGNDNAWKPIANQLDLTENADPAQHTLAAVFNTSVPTGTIVEKYTGAGYDTYEYTNGVWMPQNGAPMTDETLAPGEGAYIQNNSGAPFVVTFTGYVREGTWQTALPTGSYIEVSAIVPRAGGIMSDLGYEPEIGDQIYKLVNGQGITYTFAADADIVDYPDGWIGPDGNDSTEPTINVGESFYIEGATGYWNQVYTDVGGEVPALNLGSVTANTFTFTASGVPNTTWTVYSSAHFTNWTAAGTISLDGTGASSYEDFGITGLSSNFYKLSNGIHTSQAIGFERVVVGPPTDSGQPGQNSMLTDQLIQTAGSDNTLATAFATALPNGTQVSKWDASSNRFDTYTYSGGSWGGGGTTTLNPGEGAMLLNPTSSPLTVTFAGLVPEGKFFIQLSSGQYNLVSAVTPQAGRIKSILGYNPELGDSVITWANGGYDAYVYVSDADPLDYPDGWIGPDGNDSIDPTINFGESCFIESDQNQLEYWTQIYSDIGGIVP